MKLTMRLSFVMLVAAIIFAAFPAKPALAHSVAFAWKFGATCDTITLFLGTYHSKSEYASPSGGVALNGVSYAFTGYTENLPAGVDGSTYDAGFSDGGAPQYPTSVGWQTVTVNGLAEGTYSVTPSTSNQIEAPSSSWPKTVTITCPPAKKNVIVTTEVTVWGAIGVRGVVWQFQDDAGNWHWITVPDKSTKLVTRIEYRDKWQESTNQMIEDYAISRLVIRIGTAPTDPNRWRAYDSDTLKPLPNIWIQIYGNSAFIP